MKIRKFLRGENMKSRPQKINLKMQPFVDHCRLHLQTIFKWTAKVENFDSDCKDFATRNELKMWGMTQAFCIINWIYRSNRLKFNTPLRQLSSQSHCWTTYIERMETVVFSLLLPLKILFACFYDHRLHIDTGATSSINGSSTYSMVNFQFSDSNSNNISNSSIEKQAQTARWTWTTLGFYFWGLVSMLESERKKLMNILFCLFLFLFPSIHSPCCSNSIDS